MVDIKLIGHEERIGEIVSLHNLVFNTNITPEIWHWKYLDNPFNYQEHLISVALDNGRIVGANCFMPLELRYSNKIMKAVQSCDSMILPEYRGKGLFRKIFRLGIDYYAQQDFLLMYGFPNNNSVQPLIKEGFRKVWQIEELIRIINPEKVFSRIISNTEVSKAISFIYQKACHRINRKHNKYYVNVSNHYSSLLDNANNLCESNCLDINRSEKFYKWRFDDHPLYDYKYLYINYEGKLLGYALIGGRMVDGGLNIGYIIDCLALNNDLEVYNNLIKKSINELLQDGYDYVKTWEMHNMVLKQQLKKQFGLRSTLSFPYRYLQRNRNNSYYIVYKMNSEKHTDCDIYDTLNWRLSNMLSDTI